LAEAVLPKALSLPRLRLRALEWAIAHAEVVVLASIMAAAAALRLWGLDAKALHHDESLHATFSWYLYDGRGYTHDPLMHGPFQFNMNALSFFLFGVTDFTARLPHALFGTALVGMPYLLRRQIGAKAALIAAALLAVSPTLLYFSRFDREDIYAAFWTLAIVVCLWRYLDGQRPTWLAGLAASLAFAFATKELNYITVAVLVLFLDLALAVELSRRREGEDVDDATVVVRTAVLAPVAWLIAIAWPLLGQRPFGRERLPPIGDVLVVVGTLSAPQFAGGIQALPFYDDKGYAAASEHDLRNATVFTLLLASAYIGLFWRWQLWVLAAAAFYVPYVLLFTTFFTNPDGFLTGTWGSLDYWLPQHGERRGMQPWYYYGLLTPLYEFLPLLLGLGGAVWLARRDAPSTGSGRGLRRWLLFWLAGMFIALSIAGEKMPWLEAHIALPLALVGAVALAAAIDAVDLRGGRWLVAGTTAGLAGAAALLLVEGDEVLQAAGALLGAGLVGWVLGSLISAGPKGFGRAALAVAVGALFVLTVRAGVTASFENDDTPVEMLVYTQTTPDIPKLMERIDALARESGLGQNLTVVVDTTDGYTWPWAWYLRDYHDVRYVDIAAPDFEPPEEAVLLVHAANAARFNGSDYEQVPYKHRWWFCESYRSVQASCITSGGLSAGQMIDKLTSLDSLEALGRFFLYRRPANTSTIGSVDAVAFFPASLSAFDIAQPPAEPRTLVDGRIVFGRPGGGRGELRQPADVFVDAAGNIWVADSRNDRVQKFDAAGRFLASVGRGGTQPASFNEPWSVAVDAQGFVYVADTWNHRIQKFSPQLELVTSWGKPGAGPNSGPLELFGPRDVSVAPDATLWVTDTGNKRLIHYSLDGEPLDIFGRDGSGRGEFSEPVGIADDGRGSLYVADAWNGRIQRFRQGDASEFPVGWRSRDVLAKPYLTILRDGRILASDPENGRLLLFEADGRPAGAWRPEDGSVPLGVAALADGGFVFSDAAASTVQVVPGSLIESLFR